MNDHATIGIKIRIKHQGLERGCTSRFGAWNPLNNGLQHIVGANPLLGAGEHRVICRNRQDFLQLPFRPVDVGMRQIDLVDHWDDGQVLA